MPPYVLDIQESVKYIKNRGDTFKISGGILEHIGGKTIQVPNRDIKSVMNLGELYSVAYDDCLMLYQDMKEPIRYNIDNIKTILYFSLDPFWVFYLDQDRSIVRADDSGQVNFYRHKDLEVNWYDPPRYRNGELVLNFIRKRKTTGIKVITLIYDDKDGFYIVHENDKMPIDKIIATNSITVIIDEGTMYGVGTYCEEIYYKNIAPFTDANIVNIEIQDDDLILYLDTGEIYNYDGETIYQVV